MIGQDILWVEKYRPKTVSHTVLPKALKQTFQTFVDQKNIPNLLLVGRAGTGKTTVARAMLDELGCDYIIINGSLNGNIDTLRNEIKTFASAVSFSGGRKYVILDEADYLNANSTQPALRNFMEEYSKNCGFILTCNFKNRIIEPLQSRCSVVEFKFPKEERPQLAASFFKRAGNILEMQGIKFDTNALAEVVKQYFPDFRRTINELQRYAATGAIDAGILTNLKEESLKELVGFLKNKSFSNVRKWIGENADIDTATLYRDLYDIASEVMAPSSIPQLVLILGKYQYQSAFVADHEINNAACLTEIMVECSFK
jgi:DNA polymerase III delta prime subunit